jgi:hypothetical protein
MSRRVTYSGLLDVHAECQDCGWTALTRNALGLAAQHSDRHGHFVRIEQTTGVSYGPADHPEILRRETIQAEREAGIERPPHEIGETL